MAPRGASGRGLFLLLPLEAFMGRLESLESLSGRLSRLYVGGISRVGRGGRRIAPSSTRGISSPPPPPPA